MNIPSNLAVGGLATQFPGCNSPVFIFTDSCNFALPESLIKPKEGGKAHPVPPLKHEVKNDSPKDADQNGEESAVVGEPDSPPPQVTPVLKRLYFNFGGMTKQQAKNQVRNSEFYNRLKECYKEKLDEKIDNAISQMKVDGFLTRANGKKDTQYIPTEKLYKLFPRPDGQEAGSGHSFNSGKEIDIDSNMQKKD